MNVRVEVTMTEDDRGAENGYDTKTYKKGETYALKADLAHAFVKDRKTAIIADKKKPKAAKPAAEKKDK